MRLAQYAPELREFSIVAFTRFLRTNPYKEVILEAEDWREFILRMPQFLLDQIIRDERYHSYEWHIVEGDSVMIRTPAPQQRVLRSGTLDLTTPYGLRSDEEVVG